MKIIELIELQYPKLVFGTRGLSHICGDQTKVGVHMKIPNMFRNIDKFLLQGKKQGTMVMYGYVKNNSGCPIRMCPTALCPQLEYQMTRKNAHTPVQ